MVAGLDRSSHERRSGGSYPSHARGRVRHDSVHGTAARVTSQPLPCIAVSLTSKQCCDAIANTVGSDEEASLPACLCNRDAFALTEQLLEDTFGMELNDRLTARDTYASQRNNLPCECEVVDFASKTIRVSGRSGGAESAKMTHGFASGAHATLDAHEPERGGSYLVNDLQTREPAGKGASCGDVLSREYTPPSSSPSSNRNSSSLITGTM